MTTIDEAARTLAVLRARSVTAMWVAAALAPVMISLARPEGQAVEIAAPAFGVGLVAGWFATAAGASLRIAGVARRPAVVWFRLLGATAYAAGTALAAHVGDRVLVLASLALAAVGLVLVAIAAAPLRFWARPVLTASLVLAMSGGLVVARAFAGAQVLHGVGEILTTVGLLIGAGVVVLCHDQGFEALGTRLGSLAVLVYGVGMLVANRSGHGTVLDLPLGVAFTIAGAALQVWWWRRESTAEPRSG